MTKIIALTLLLAAAAAPASAGILDLSGLADLVASKAKESRASSTVYWDGKVAGGAYLPVWTFKGAGPDGAKYAALGFGGEFGGGASPRPLITINGNLPAISARLWSSAWAQDHVLRTKLPPLWAGPSIRSPASGESFRWDDWKSFVGFIVSIGIGG